MFYGKLIDFGKYLFFSKNYYILFYIQFFLRFFFQLMLCLSFIFGSCVLFLVFFFINLFLPIWLFKMNICSMPGFPYMYFLYIDKFYFILNICSSLSAKFVFICLEVVFINIYYEDHFRLWDSDEGSKVLYLRHILIIFEQ